MSASEHQIEEIKGKVKRRREVLNALLSARGESTPEEDAARLHQACVHRHDIQQLVRMLSSIRGLSSVPEDTCSRGGGKNAPAPVPPPYPYGTSEERSPSEASASASARARARACAEEAAGDMGSKSFESAAAATPPKPSSYTTPHSAPSVSRGASSLEKKVVLRKEHHGGSLADKKKSRRDKSNKSGTLSTSRRGGVGAGRAGPGAGAGAGTAGAAGVSDMEENDEDHGRVGSVQAFVTNLGSADDFGSSSFGVENVHRIGILDIRLFNMDRHLGNLLVAKPAGGSLLNNHNHHAQGSPNSEISGTSEGSWSSADSSRGGGRRRHRIARRSA